MREAVDARVGGLAMGPGSSADDARRCGVEQPLDPALDCGLHGGIVIYDRIGQAQEEGAGDLHEKLLEDLHVTGRGAHVVPQGPFELKEPVLRIGLRALRQAPRDCPPSGLAERDMRLSRFSIERGRHLGVADVGLDPDGPGFASSHA
jgi:hypothetical protein